MSDSNQDRKESAIVSETSEGNEALTGTEYHASPTKARDPSASKSQTATDIRQMLEVFEPDNFVEKADDNTNQQTIVQIQIPSVECERIDDTTWEWINEDRGFRLSFYFGGLLNPNYPQEVDQGMVRVNGHSNYMPAMQAILLVAGANDICDWFYQALLYANDTKFSWRLAEKLKRPWFSPKCMKYAMHKAAVEALAARTRDYNSKNHPVDSVHYLVAALCKVNAETSKNEEDPVMAAKNLNELYYDDFHAKIAESIIPEGPNAKMYATYAGAFIGIYAAGVMQYGIDQKERDETEARVFEAYVNTVGAFISLVPKTGGTIAGIIAAWAPVLSHRIYHHEDMSQEVAKLIGILDDEISSCYGLLAESFSEGVRIVFRRSGFIV